MTTKLESDMKRLRVAGAMRPDVGRVRSANEDTFAFVAPADGSPEEKLGYLALAADGMGGHAAGEVASSFAAKSSGAFSIRPMPPRHRLRKRHSRLPIRLNWYPLHAPITRRPK